MVASTWCEKCGFLISAQHRLGLGSCKYKGLSIITFELQCFAAGCGLNRKYLLVRNGCFIMLPSPDVDIRMKLVV